jgi:hypothetical protein
LGMALARVGMALSLVFRLLERRLTAEKTDL